MATRTWQDFDLLRRRRELLGIEPPLPVARPGALWKSKLIGIGFLATGLAGWLGLFAYARVLENQEKALQPAGEEHRGLQAQLAEQSKNNETLAKANQALANAILAIPSAALLLGDLAASTPAAVQLTQASVEGAQLQLSGVAVQPQALRTINAFQLLLERSALFQPQQVQLNKITTTTQGQVQAGQQVQALTFNMTAALEPAATKANLSRLEALGATGLRRRLAVLQQEGLLK